MMGQARSAPLREVVCFQVMSSFRRHTGGGGEAVPSTRSLPGTRPWVNGQTLTSTGNRDLDGVCAWCLCSLKGFIHMGRMSSGPIPDRDCGRGPLPGHHHGHRRGPLLRLCSHARPLLSGTRRCCWASMPGSRRGKHRLSPELRPRSGDSTTDDLVFGVQEGKESLAEFISSLPAALEDRHKANESSGGQTDS